MGNKNSGRRLRLTQEIQDKIVEHLKAGAFKSHAAAAVGLSRMTIDEWLRRGSEGEEPYAAFALAVNAAIAEDAIRNQGIISRAAFQDAPGDWRAAAWNLERKHPKLYGHRQERRHDEEQPKPNADRDAIPTGTIDDHDLVISPWIHMQ